MQGVGLDWIDFTRRPPAREQQECHPQQQPAETRDQKGAQWLNLDLTRKTIPRAEVKKRHMERFDRRAHGRHHQSASGSDQRRKHHQARFVGANECP